MGGGKVGMATRESILDGALVARWADRVQALLTAMLAGGRAPVARRLRDLGSGLAHPGIHS